MVHAPAPGPPPGATRGGDPPARTLPTTGDPVLATRFSVPAVPATFVRRARLARLLGDAVRKPLILVNGPAGAGKTLCVADWLAQDPLPWPTAWLTLERGDAAPGLFWSYVLEALRHHGVPLPREIGSPARADAVDRAMLARLAAYLQGRTEPVLLVLDEFDRADAREVADQLEFVLRHAGDGLRLLLVSRTEPLLPLHRRRAADEIADIRAADLAFTARETALLLARHGLGAGHEAALLLTRRTEGWAAGVRLCALAMGQSHDPCAFLADFEAGHSAVADFLLGEVLAGQPDETQELLLRTSILDRVHPDLADALTGRGEAARILAGLERANAFVTSVGHSWYRLHPLFAEILRVHLGARHPGIEQDLHRTTARWLSEAGQLDAALGHAAAAGDWEFAAGRFIDGLGIGQLFTGLDTQRLDDVLSRMPPHVRGQAPDMIRAARSLARYDVGPGLAHLRRAEQAEQAEQAARAAGSAAPGGHRGDRAPDRVAVRLSLALLRVTAGGLLGSADTAEAAAVEAEAFGNALPPEQLRRHPELPALLLTSLGAAELWAGRLDTATEALSAAAGTADLPVTVSPRHEALGRIAMIDFLRGWPARAETAARAAIAVAEQGGLPPARRSGVAHLVLAAVAVDRDELDAARAGLCRAAASPGARHDPVVISGIALLNSRLLLAHGDPQGSLRALSGADDRSPVGVRSPWVRARLALAAAAAHLAQGRPRDALAALERADPTATGTPECALLAARARLAVGDAAAAAGILDALDTPDSVARDPSDRSEGPTITVRTLLARAEAAERAADAVTARDLAVRALDAARPERLRRPFLEAGPWLARALRGHPVPDDPWLPPAIVGRRPGAAPDGARPVVVEPLSDREYEVLRCVAQMKSTEEVAEELFLSVNTVKSHLKSIFRKLCATRRGEAVRRARELDLL
ncbi:LuxR C-terminal-related transcriptional regulator [Streptomyces sp. V4-01]|uniref:LuxR C-terminal-related transcriptional regulator n=1 Tax=Actinacidiphila polyblastidii TaxID=3110430 RepID=A0ABU7PH57_9ACTN|nr:LuxR C-terminal-related transcriptional regulator [Streptomyces sp. V4-01]